MQYHVEIKTVPSQTHRGPHSQQGQAGRTACAKVVPRLLVAKCGRTSARQPCRTGRSRHLALYLDCEINLEVGVEATAPFVGANEPRRLLRDAGRSGCHGRAPWPVPPPWAQPTAPLSSIAPDHGHAAGQDRTGRCTATGRRRSHPTPAPTSFTSCKPPRGPPTNIVGNLAPPASGRNDGGHTFFRPIPT